MMIKRPQSLFPFLSLDELLSHGVERMAMEIRKNSGLVAVLFVLCVFVSIYFAIMLNV